MPNVWELTDMLGYVFPIFLGHLISGFLISGIWITHAFVLVVLPFAVE